MNTLKRLLAFLLTTVAASSVSAEQFLCAGGSVIADHVRWTQTGRLGLHAEDSRRVIWTSTAGQKNITDDEGNWQPYILAGDNNSIRFADTEVTFSGLSDTVTDSMTKTVAVDKKIAGSWTAVSITAQPAVSTNATDDGRMEITRQFACDDGSLTLVYTFSPHNIYKLDLAYQSKGGGEYRFKETYTNIPTGTVSAMTHKEATQGFNIGSSARVGFPSDRLSSHGQVGRTLVIYYTSSVVGAGESMELDPTWNKDVQSGNDDAYDEIGVWMYTTDWIEVGNPVGVGSSDLYLRWDPDEDITGTVNSCSLFFRTYAGSGNIKSKIVGLATTDIGDLSTDRTGVAETTAAVDWDFAYPGDLTSLPSTDFTSVMQEIISNGYGCGTTRKAFCIKVKDDGTGDGDWADFSSYEHGTIKPNITIDYTPAVGWEGWIDTIINPAMVDNIPTTQIKSIDGVE
jgi:hypothetical protein